MGVQQKKVFVHDLELGMFVSDLDRPWHQTPFPIQGFYIRTQDDIRAITSHCKWVSVDVAESRDKENASKDGKTVFGRSRSSDASRRQEIKLPPLNIREPVHHETVTTLRKELKVSRKLMVDAETALHRVFQSVHQNRLPELTDVARVTRGIVSSVVRNPNAVLWLSRTRHYDDYTYRHAMNTAVWALICGRELGLNEGLLNHLAMGCLLSQVGKLKLPASILENEGRLDSEDYVLYRTYVEKGVQSLEDSGVSRAVLSVVEHHRERHNGSGFPAGIRGDRIPLLAKVAGLSECFESLIGPRKLTEAMTPARAVSLLYDLRNIEFQEDLVEKFISAIGVYPTGSLVELNDGQRGVVVSHSPERRLWPKVMVMTDRAHKPLKTARIIDIAKYNEGRSAEEAMSILECLPTGTDGLHPENYDVTGAETRWALSRMIGA
ncbi:HD-GYP domain-containing protein [Marinobacter confluentis]|uniref:HD-GYP domain-containing protein n=1 Tax=Marinobacter confluentis TaxID=1697557 RepID=A0A4Z1C847_9GAMM|nr:HD-GYP domain-containing protein [Marinobacter confluentis]TGN41820.1 HD-GYP domain-containing protein [Marinobacter confluentis]